MAGLTWELVVAILGGLITFLTFMYSMLGKNKNGSEPKAEPETGIVQWRVDLEKDNILIFEQIKNMRSDLDAIKEDMNHQVEYNRDLINKLETKLDKLTDIVIEHFRRN